MPPDVIDVPGNPCPEGAQFSLFSGPGSGQVRAFLLPAPEGRPRGTCIVCPGRTEFIEKYFETARALQDRGFAVLVPDWPGQGLSQRLTRNRLKGHIDRFATYRSALEGSLTAFGDLPRPHVVLAHSMGGAIALDAIEHRAINVEAAAFCAPMWGLGLKWRQLGLIRMMCMTGRARGFVFNPGLPERFEDNIVTRDKNRWQLNHDLTEKAPQLAVGPFTWGWLSAAARITHDITKARRLQAVNVPVLVASAGDEKLVDNRAHARVARLLPDCEHVDIRHAMHEILMETDDRQAEFWGCFDRLLVRAGI